MSTPKPEFIAGIKLLEGRSGRSVWMFEGRGGVSIGSGPACRWRIEAPGVHQLHVLVYFDGESLWISDLARAGNVHLNGQPIGIWHQVPHAATLTVGGARLELRCARDAKRAAAPARRPSPPPPLPLPPVPVSVEQSQPLPGRHTRPVVLPKVDMLETLAAPMAAAASPVPADEPPEEKPASRWEGVNLTLVRRLVLGAVLVAGLGVSYARRNRTAAAQPPPYVIVSAVPGTAVQVETRSLAPAATDGAMTTPKAAVELLVNGRTAEAARAYAELAAREPNEPAYSVIARILADRLRGPCPGGGDDCEP